MKQNIAYLVPEFPSVSMTFVTNEMVELKRRNYPLKIFALHGSEKNKMDTKSYSLKTDVTYVYRNLRRKGLAVLLTSFLAKPLRFTKVFSFAVKSSFFSLTGKNRLSNLGHFVAGLYIGQIMTKEKINHIHAHFAHYPASVAMYASMISGVSFSFTAHANDIFENRTLLSEKEKSAKKVVTISEYNRKHFIDQSNIQVVRCGIDLKEYKFHNSARVSETLVIGTLGRLVEKKGMDVLFKAVHILVRKNIKIKLNIAGTGPEKENLMVLANQLGIENHVVWEGAISNENVHQWLQTVDVFALACKKDCKGDMDGIPVVLMEAMATGVPVISTEISGIPELIKKGITGLLAQPDHVESFASKLEIYYSNRYRMNLVTSYARQKIENEFSLEKSVDQLEIIFGV